MVSAARRQDFPLLSRRVDDRPICYLDSAASSLTPTVVLDRIRDYYENHRANVHRGKHLLSQEASELYLNARRILSSFVGVQPDETIFTAGMTDSANIVSRGLVLAKDDVILVPEDAHHSNIAPWQTIGNVKFVPTSPEYGMDLGSLSAMAARYKPRLIAISHASNVTGAIVDLEATMQVVKETGALSFVDAAQSIPHLRVDFPRIGADFVAFSGHKMLGPTGIGILAGRGDSLDLLQPTTLGGGAIVRLSERGVELRKRPYRLEAGTPNIAGAIGLGAAAQYILDIGYENIAAHEEKLADLLQARLSKMGVTFYMSERKPRLAIALVPGFEHLHADHIALALSDSYGVMCRSGLHCAHPFFERTPAPYGALRISAYVYNTAEDIDRVADGLEAILKTFGILRR